jgi:hypothetical protein
VEGGIPRSVVLESMSLNMIHSASLFNRLNIEEEEEEEEREKINQRIS